MLRPGSNLPPEEVAKNQRERLFAALVATVADKGFEATTVADLVELSGVSRSAFYEHFANKEACFLESLEAIVDAVREVVTAKYDGKGSALQTFAKLIARAATNVDDLYERAFAAAHQDGGGMPPEIVRAISGGLLQVIHARICRDEASAVTDLIDQLRDWSLGYEPPPLPLRGTRQRPIPIHTFEGYNEVDRICRATAEVVAEKGYANATTADIAEHAHISLKTFYAHFANKEEAVLATLDVFGALMMAVVVPAARRAQDWRHGVRGGCEAVCSFLAAEPAFAKLAFHEVYVAGPQALERRDRIIRSLEALLAPGFEEHPKVPAIAGEAIGGAIYTLLREQIHNGSKHSLPRIVPFATYLALEPFVGPYEAAVIASDDRRPRKRGP